MAAAAASGVVGGVTFTAAQKGEAGNLIGVVIAMPAAATGAAVLAESGNLATVSLAADGPTGVISSTISGVKAAFNTGRLVVASGGTDGNTGVAATGVLAAGTSGAAGYDDLAAATGDGWILTNVAAPGDGQNAHSGIDILEKVISVGPGVGHRVRASGSAATGATAACRAAYSEELRRAKLGYPRSLRKIGETGAGEYVV